MPTTKLSSPSAMPNNNTATPPPKFVDPDATQSLDSPPEDTLEALLDAERAAERWIRLDSENLLRVSDFRRIRQGLHFRSEKEIQGQLHHAIWPFPSLTINNDLELPRPLWTVEELLAVIGAEVVEPPRSENQMEWQIGKQIRPEDEASLPSM